MTFSDDPLVQELVPEFIDQWIIDMKEQYLPAIESKNADELYRVGHTLKGSGYQFGMTELGDIGKVVMAEAKAANWERAAELYKEIGKMLVDAKEEFAKLPKKQ